MQHRCPLLVDVVFGFGFLQLACTAGTTSFTYHTNLKTGRQLPFQVCNGRWDLCHLRFNQVTLLGSHNAGSYGYSRGLKCVYANHNVDEVGQLNRGARLLDMDVCLRDDTVKTRHGRGALAQILRPLEEALRDVSEWVDAHPQEVVMLSFGDNDPTDAVSKAKQANAIAELLHKYFAKPRLALIAKDISEAVDGQKKWPTLEEMISSGRRVVLAFEGDSEKPKNDLYSEVPKESHDFIMNLAVGFHYTYSKDNKADYQTLLKYLKYYCSSDVDTKSAIHFDLFLKPFRPRMDANASNKEVFLWKEPREKGCFCNECTAKQLNLAASRPRGSSGISVLERAYQKCSQNGGQVHAVKLDFEEYGDVGSVIWRLNDENVRRYCPTCLLDPAPLNTKSSAMAMSMLFMAMMYMLIVLF